jgi:ABC-type antimicrobial peptide transport system permease subunit
MGGSRYFGIFSSVTDQAAHTGIWGQSITMNNAPPMQIYPLRLRRILIQPPLPALASDAFLNTTKLEVGDVIRTSINGVEIDFRIAGALHYFPTMYDESQNGYLVISRDLLLPLLNENQEAPVNPNEVFVETGGSLSLDSLSAMMPASSQGWSAENIHKNLTANPLSLGLRSSAFFGFALTALLSLMGFSTYFYLSIRQREALYGIMRALGISGRQLYAWIVLEQAILVLAGLILGTMLGLLLNQITLPRLPISLGEGQVIPPFMPQTDWAAIGQLYLGLLSAFLIVIAIVTALLWRAHLERILRMGQES